MGIRIVPEFDIPGHSKGFEPLAWGSKPDILFCGELPNVNQLYDDPEVCHNLPFVCTST